ncbi:MAG: hypothetical protein ABTQ27_05215 [Amaricoccus sp.]|uniref:hypothetical protein n=1 Tax=Amaricoccus sp. TaxID=1872485 RepID=UPI003315D295
MTRLELLAQRHWGPFLHLPGLADLPDPDLRAADSFFGFVARHGVADPQPHDIAVWASSDGDDPAQRIAQLSKAMAVLVPAFVGRVGEAAAALPRGKATSGDSAPASNAGATAAPRRPAAHDWDPIARPARKAPRKRTVSVYPWELPADIQDALRRMARGIPGNDVVVSPQIMRRLREKMCQFAWSAQRAGLPVALSEEAVLRYQEDVTARSRGGKNGLRWATIRASIEEIYRYARYIGAPEEISRILAKDSAILESRENRQKALKHAALARTGNTTMSLLDQADDLLEAAEVAAEARKRHQMRNGACILGIYPVAPLRNASAYLIFGVTLFWRSNAWVIDTEIRKTLAFNPDPFVMALQPQHGRFIDAVLLGDAPPRYLPQLRKQALDAERPLFVLPDGTPAAASYVPRIFKEMTKNSFTTTRTMLHTDLSSSIGIAGREMAMAACHQVGKEIHKKYETDLVAVSAVNRRQGVASARRERHGLGRALEL